MKLTRRSVDATGATGNTLAPGCAPISYRRGDKRVCSVSPQEPVERDGSGAGKRQSSGDQAQQQRELVPSLTEESLRPVCLARRYCHIGRGDKTGGPRAQPERQPE